MANTKEKSNVLQTLSAILSRTKLAGLFGRQYGGNRDIYTALGYSKTLTYQDFLSQYVRQDIASAIINRPVNKTWSGPLRIADNRDDDETPLERAFEEMEKALKLKSAFSRLDKLTGLGRYGVLLLGFDDVMNKEGFRKPIQKATALKLLYVKPLGEESATITAYETDPRNPRYGLPTFYTVTMEDEDAAKQDIVTIHHSRILHVIDGQMESDIFGTPRLEVGFNRLKDLEKLVGGSAEMFWRNARPGFNLDVEPDYEFSSAERDLVKTQLEEYEHDLRRVFSMEGIKMNPMTLQVANPKDHVDVQIQMLSAAYEIPKRILTGSERGELSSGQDSDEWSKYIQSRREEFAEAKIVRPFVDLMLELGVLPPPTDLTTGYDVSWQDLFSISEKEKVDIGKVRSESLKAYLGAAGSDMVIPPEAFYEFMLGLTQHQINLIMEMKEAYQMEVEDAEQRRMEEEELMREEQEVEPEPVEGPGQ